MSQGNKELVAKFYAAMLDGVDAAAEFVTDDMKDNNPPPIPDYPGGKEGFRMIMNMWMAAFSDVKVSADFMVAEGDKVAVAGTWSAKHTGSMMGEEATNKEIEGKFVEIIRFENGKMAERWGFGNDMEVFGALGIKPPGA